VFASVAVVAELETFPVVEIVASFVSAKLDIEELKATAPVPSKETAAAVTSPVIEKF